MSHPRLTDYEFMREYARVQFLASSDDQQSQVVLMEFETIHMHRLREFWQAWRKKPEPAPIDPPEPAPVDEYGHKVDEHGEPYCTCGGKRVHSTSHRCYECFRPKPKETK